MDDFHQQRLCHTPETGLESRSSGKTQLFKAELIVKSADMKFVTQMKTAFDQRCAIFV